MRFESLLCYCTFCRLWPGLGIGISVNFWLGHYTYDFFYIFLAALAWNILDVIRSNQMAPFIVNFSFYLWSVINVCCETLVNQLRELFRIRHGPWLEKIQRILSLRLLVLLIAKQLQLLNPLSILSLY